MIVCRRWAMAISVRPLNSSRTVFWSSASVSTSMLAVASSSTRIWWQPADRRTDFLAATRRSGRDRQAGRQADGQMAQLRVSDHTSSIRVRWRSADRQTDR
jgi:hypothetical protein